MKKFLVLFICVFSTSVMAQEYGFYEEYVADEDAHDICNCNCPKCPSVTESAAPAGPRETYTGVRLYKNEHASYYYKNPDGNREKYNADNFGFGTVVGNRLTDFARIEFETLYTGSKYDKHDTSFDYDIWANMLNVYLFREFGGAVSPYAGLGLGLTGIWGEINNELDNAFNLSYQAMVGVWFDLNARVALDLGFKYVNYGRVEHNVGSSRIDATQIYLGASYKFSM